MSAMSWWRTLLRRLFGRRFVSVPPPPRPALRGRPAPGEIWWADVPYQEGNGSKIRPCLVLRTGRGGSTVLKITSQDQSTRAAHLRLPTAGWDPRADRSGSLRGARRRRAGLVGEHDSWLDLRAPYQLRQASFQRRAGVVDARSWKAVRRSHQTGWVT
jgi:hypothetical protein